MEKSYLIYDERCSFCTRWTMWCLRKNPQLEALPVRQAAAKALLRKCGVHFMDLQTVYFISHNRVFVRSGAVFEVVKRLHSPVKYIAWFQFLPVSFTDFFYKLFARYRYRFQASKEPKS